MKKNFLLLMVVLLGTFNFCAVPNPNSAGNDEAEGEVGEVLPGDDNQEEVASKGGYDTTTVMIGAAGFTTLGVGAGYLTKRALTTPHLAGDVKMQRGSALAIGTSDKTKLKDAIDKLGDKKFTDITDYNDTGNKLTGKECGFFKVENKGVFYVGGNKATGDLPLTKISACVSAGQGFDDHCSVAKIENDAELKEFISNMKSYIKTS